MESRILKRGRDVGRDEKKEADNSKELLESEIETSIEHSSDVVEVGVDGFGQEVEEYFEEEVGGTTALVVSCCSSAGWELKAVPDGVIQLPYQLYRLLFFLVLEGDEASLSTMTQKRLSR